MKLVHHKELTLEKWQAYSLAERMANIGSEVIRTLNWQHKDTQQAALAFERSLELFDLTKMTTKSVQLREISRLKEAWVDFISGLNTYKITKEVWENEFLQYTVLARNTNRTG